MRYLMKTAERRELKMAKLVHRFSNSRAADTIKLIKRQDKSKGRWKTCEKSYIRNVWYTAGVGGQ